MRAKRSRRHTWNTEEIVVTIVAEQSVWWRHLSDTERPAANTRAKMCMRSLSTETDAVLCRYSVVVAKFYARHAACERINLNKWIYVWQTMFVVGTRATIHSSEEKNNHCVGSLVDAFWFIFVFAQAINLSTLNVLDFHVVGDCNLILCTIGSRQQSSTRKYGCVIYT